MFGPLIRSVSGTWIKSAETMLTARVHYHTAVLPDGKVLIAGGRNASGEVLEVELFDPDATVAPWIAMDPLDSSRSHHGTLALLPDGRVVVAGESLTQDVTGDWCVAVYAIQIFSPPYLYQVDLEDRPKILNDPQPIGCGAFTLDTSVAVDAVSLIRLASVTHGNNFDQRFIPLPIVSSSSGRGGYSVTVEAPKNQYVAPPGYYMLFVLADGVPSEAEMVQVDLNPSANSTCADLCGDPPVPCVCTFDLYHCPDASCTNEPAAYGDTVGSGAICGPDGTVGLPDVLAVLDAFGGVYHFPCDQHNHDIVGNTTGDCTPNGLIDLTDITAVLDAFQGIDPCCSSQSSQSGGSGGLAGSGGEAVLILVPRHQGPPADGLFEIDVFVAQANDLRGYQLAMEVDQAVADSVTLEAVYIDGQRTDHVFAGLEYHDAIDIANARMAASMVQGGASPNGRAYLATFAFRISSEAQGSPVFRVLLDGASIMLDSAGRNMEITGGDDVSFSLP